MAVCIQNRGPGIAWNQVSVEAQYSDTCGRTLAVSEGANDCRWNQLNQGSRRRIGCVHGFRIQVDCKWMAPNMERLGREYGSGPCRKAVGLTTIQFWARQKCK